MPLPIILAGIAAISATAAGVGAHISAKKTNEQAQSIANDAENLYNMAKDSLEKAQGEMEQSLLCLGMYKKKVLDTSIQQFLISYGRIKNVEISDSAGVDELKNFYLEKQDVIQLREIYESTLSSGGAGAATGAIVALAIAVPVAPIAAIVAPLALFSGISAKMKANDNLDKANVMYAEAEAASEKMKTSELICSAIANRADMYNELLDNLNRMFSYCTGMLDGVTRKKMGVFRNKVDARKFTDDELKLVAVSRALAGAVKAVIDTPLLTAEGVISSEAEDKYKDIKKELPRFSAQVNEVKSVDYSVKSISATAQNVKNPVSVLDVVRNVFSIIVGISMALLTQMVFADNLIVGLLAFAIPTLIIMNNDVEIGFFKLVKNICCLSISAAFSMLFYNSCHSIVYMNHYIIGSIIVGFASVMILGWSIPNKGEKCGNFKRTIARIFGCIFFFALAVLVYAFLYKFISISHSIAAVIVVSVYALFALASVYVGD